MMGVTLVVQNNMPEKYKTMVSILFSKIPEVYTLYLDEKDYYKEYMEMPHIIYGDLLTPYLINLLRDDKEKSTIKKIFDFLEELSNDEVIEIVNVVQVTVLEGLGDDKDILKTGYKYMGPQTRILSDEIEKYWGRL